MERLRVGMVGGVSNFGKLHTRCVVLDRIATLSAGCFSRDSAKNAQLADAFGIPSDRLYPDAQTMAREEARRPDPVDFVIVSTPNVSHYDITRTFLENGFHVMLDKPMTRTAAEAVELAELAERKRLLLSLTYTFVGYPAIRQIREAVQHGDLGTINGVTGEFAQCWLAEEFIREGKIDKWRVDPKIAGISCCTADIGLHIEAVVRFATGLEIDRVSACLDSFGYGTKLELNSMVSLKYRGGAAGHYFASQVCAGSFNDLRIRIFGDKGSAQWTLDRADEAVIARFNEPPKVYNSMRPYLYQGALQLSRSTHPEGVYGALSNIYRAFCANLVRLRRGEPVDTTYPDAWDGVASLKYLEAVVKSAADDNAWVAVEP
jgi:predicted dehydrogenase